MFKRLRKKIFSVRKKQSNKEIVINLEIDSKEIAKQIISHIKANSAIDDIVPKNQGNRLNILEIKSSKDQTKIFIDSTEIKAYENFNMSVERKNIVKISLDIICLLK